MRFLLALLLAAVWIPGALLQGGPPDDQDSSGDDSESSGSGSGDDYVLDATPSSTSTRASPTTDSNKVIMIDPESAVTSQAPPTTARGGMVTTHQTAGVPAGRGVVTEDHLRGQSTSASPDAHEGHSTSRPTKIHPLADEGIPNKMGTTPSHSIIIPTTTAKVALNTTVVKLDVPFVPESVHTPTEKTHPTPTAVAPPQDKVPSITEHVSMSDVSASTPTPLPMVPEDPIIKQGRAHGVGSEIERDNDIILDEEEQATPQQSGQHQSLMDRKEVLAGVISGGVVGLAFAVLLVSLMVYRMKKKDEGSYSLDEHKHPNVGYQRPQAQEEFLA